LQVAEKLALHEAMDMADDVPQPSHTHVNIFIQAIFSKPRLFQ
jgi:hypothetical protein